MINSWPFPFIPIGPKLAEISLRDHFHQYVQMPLQDKFKLKLTIIFHGALDMRGSETGIEPWMLVINGYRPLLLAHLAITQMLTTTSNADYRYIPKSMKH